MKNRKIIRELEYIKLSDLKGINILFENDFYELAKLSVKMNDASDKKRGNVESRPTINGLSNLYSYIIGSTGLFNSEEILNIVKNHGIKEGVPVNYDK